MGSMSVFLDRRTPSARPDSPRYDQPGLFSDGAPDVVDFQSAVEHFGEFPYSRAPYSARNWGHPLHSLCSYASKMKPAIASMLVSLFTEPESMVLDPFSGAGTVPFEACLQGRRGIAGDLSPLAFCLSSAKVNPPTPDETAEFLDALESYVCRSQPPTGDVVEPEIVTFFHPDTLTEIVNARQFFEEREAAHNTIGAHWFVKACVLHILHGNRPYALSRRSHGIIPIPPKGPTTYKPLMKSLREKVTRMALAQLPTTFRAGEAFQASALATPLPEASVDAIITSPPFLGTTEFLRQNRLRLWFSGWPYNRQAEEKAGGQFLEYHKTLEVYGAVLIEFRRVIASGGLVVLHLGVVKKADMGAGIMALAPSVGFDPIRLLYEDTTRLESHGRTDRGATHQHQFLFLRPS